MIRIEYVYVYYGFRDKATRGLRNDIVNFRRYYPCYAKAFYKLLSLTKAVKECVGYRYRRLEEYFKSIGLFKFYGDSYIPTGKMIEITVYLEYKPEKLRNRFTAEVRFYPIVHYHVTAPETILEITETKMYEARDTDIDPWYWIDLAIDVVSRLFEENYGEAPIREEYNVIKVGYTPCNDLELTKEKLMKLFPKEVLKYNLCTLPNIYFYAGKHVCRVALVLKKPHRHAFYDYSNKINTESEVYWSRPLYHVIYPYTIINCIEYDYDKAFKW